MVNGWPQQRSNSQVDVILLCGYPISVNIKHLFEVFGRLAAIALLIANASIFGVSAASDTIQGGTASAVRHAIGSFEVSVRSETTQRFAMSKTYVSGMAGTSEGVMIGDSIVTAYTALERFEGVVDGRRGQFLLLHRGYMSDAEGMNLDIIIAPNSGTAELAGIRGTLTIRIEGDNHFYDLAYSLATE